MPGMYIISSGESATLADYFPCIPHDLSWSNVRCMITHSRTCTIVWTLTSLNTQACGRNFLRRPVQAWGKTGQNWKTRVRYNPPGQSETGMTAEQSEHDKTEKRLESSDIMPTQVWSQLNSSWTSFTPPPKSIHSREGWDGNKNPWRGWTPQSWDQNGTRVKSIQWTCPSKYPSYS